MNIFYQPLLSGLSLPASIVLDADESFHSIKVLRLKQGDSIKLTDGQGRLYDGIIDLPDVKKCSVVVRSSIQQKRRSYHLHIGIAPTKNIDRFEWFLEKSTEIGIDEITPIICEFSERTSIRTDRLNKILVSAMKQSMNLYLPVLNEPVRFTDLVHKDSDGQKFIGYVEEQQEELLKNKYIAGSDVIILIGPEGDFSRAELSLATSSGFSPISLGDSRLRTETAGLTACSQINFMNL